jgi:tRNA-dihydrouridine synthase C
MSQSTGGREKKQRMTKNKKIWLDPLPLKHGAPLPSRVFPGPMEGIMLPLYCRVFHQLKLTDYWMTPFIRISNSTYKVAALEKFITPFTAGGLPVIVQLLGRDIELLSATVEQLKAFDIAGINFNFACPSRKVMKKGNGGKALLEPDYIAMLLEKIRKILPDISLSVKLRSGFSSADEMEKIIPACLAADVDFMVMHYRTVTELYQPVENGAERLKRAVELAGTVPVIGSGDIFTPADAENMLSKSGVAGVIAARGLLRDPWLVRRIQGVEIAGQKDKFFKLFSELIEQEPALSQGRGYLLELARNLWGVDSPQFCQLSGRKL